MALQRDAGVEVFSNDPAEASSTSEVVSGGETPSGTAAGTGTATPRTTPPPAANGDGQPADLGLAAWQPVVAMLSVVPVEVRMAALELADELLAGGGSRELRAQLGMPADPGACAPTACPEEAEEEPAVYPVWRQAELCIQQHYRQTHEFNTVGTNRDWLYQVGKTTAEIEALACLRDHFVGPSGMYPGEPDLWDFTNRTMYEITTRSGAEFRKGKLKTEVELANDITGNADCGGTLYSPGDWAPQNCLYVGEGLTAEVTNESGVLIYRALRPAGKKKKVNELEFIGLLYWLLKLLSDPTQRPQPLRPIPATPPGVPATPLSPVPTRILKCIPAPDFWTCFTGNQWAS